MKINDQSKKICIKCKKQLDRDCFNKRKGYSQDGLYNDCKKCRIEYDKKRRSEKKSGIIVAF